MKFQPGNKAGGGRKKGSKNKAGKTLRDTISNFLEQEFEGIKACFEALPPKDRAKLYCDLLQYGLPKLQALNMDLNFDGLSEKQLDEIINKLIQKQNEATQLQYSEN